MEFYSAPGTKRPVRLSEKTRKFAYDSLHFKYGKDTRKLDFLELESSEGMSWTDKYDLAITEIAKNAPIRICGGELLSGAATLGAAIDHKVPAFVDGNYVCSSISHLTVDFEKVLKKGWNGLLSEIEESEKEHSDDEKKLRFLKSCRVCIDAFFIYRQRYLDSLKDMKGYEDNYKNLLKVPAEPATNFYEAVQSIWFTFSFLRLCGNWPGIGRIDEMLEPYLEKDLASGAITIERAREILAHFFIKGCEWICGGDYGSGDAQHYQNLVLSGIDENGRDVTGKVTYLVLDIIEELGIGDFPTTVRINKNTDEKLIARVAEVIKYGGGIIAIYNEDLILDSLTSYGYELSEARKFANDGCWEVQIPGKTYFMYMPFDSLKILQDATLDKYSGSKTYESFDELLSQYKKDLSDEVAEIIEERKRAFFVPECDRWKDQFPCTVISLWEEGCIKKALNYREGGPIYNVASPHIGGLPDTANSLYAIKKLVFDEKKISLEKLCEALRNDWKGEEKLYTYIRANYRFFGNDNDEVDLIANDILVSFADMCKELGKNLPVMFPSGVSTFGRQIEWAPFRMAAAQGTKAHSILSGNMSPTPGTDKDGATAIIRSYCKCSLVRQTTGAALDISLLPSSVKGDDGVAAISGLIKGFVKLGGYFMQLDVTDAEILRCAQKCPEDYETLSVRVSGWNARFITLDKEWQDMIIERDSK